MSIMHCFTLVNFLDIRGEMGNGVMFYRVVTVQFA